MDTGNRMKDKESRLIRIILIAFIVMILLRTQVFAKQAWPSQGQGTAEDP